MLNYIENLSIADTCYFENIVYHKYQLKNIIRLDEKTQICLAPTATSSGSGPRLVMYSHPAWRGRVLALTDTPKGGVASKPPLQVRPSEIQVSS